MNRIAVVILNWNGKALLEQFLPSVVKFSDREWADVIVADNASTDDSISFLKKYYPKLQVIQMDQNYGFADGYNRALAQLDHEYFVLLNSDVEVSENWLDPIYRQFEEEPQIAAIQPKIKAQLQKSHFEYAGACGGYIDYLGYPFCRGRIMDEVEEDKEQYNTSTSIFWASGAALFVRSKIYKNLGGLDADFFAHMEEIDLCWRIKNAGYQIVCNPKSTIYHVGGATLPTNSSRKLFLNFRNNLLMLYKNLPEKGFYSIFLSRMILDGVAAIKFLAGGEFANFAAVFKAHMNFYILQKKFKNKRDENLKRTKNSSHPEIYSKSIVFDYFLKKKRQFDELNF